MKQRTFQNIYGPWREHNQCFPPTVQQKFIKTNWDQSSMVGYFPSRNHPISTKDLVIMTTGGIYILGMGAGTMEIKLCNEKRQELLTV